MTKLTYVMYFSRKPKQDIDYAANLFVVTVNKAFSTFRYRNGARPMESAIPIDLRVSHPFLMKPFHRRINLASIEHAYR